LNGEASNISKDRRPDGGEKKIFLVEDHPSQKEMKKKKKVKTNVIDVPRGNKALVGR